MTSKLRLALAGALLTSTIASVPVIAEAQVSVRGVRSCGVWARDRDNSDKAWLVGFLSGMAFQSNIDALRGTDNETMYMWIDKFCRDNPLKDIADGAEELFGQLRRKRGL